MGSAVHPVHDSGTGATGPLPGWLLAAAVPAVLALAYLWLVARSRRGPGGRGWSGGRVAGFLTGCVLLALALVPPVAPLAHDDFRGHMLQHMLIGMYAPLGLVLGAPLTLLLRALPTGRARRLTRFLHSRGLRLLANPATALMLSTGTLAALYFTPLYNMTAGNPVLHWAVHAHFLLSGCLFAYVIAGPDPAPARPGVPVRLAVLGVAVAAHAAVAQLMYGGFLIDVHAPVPEVRGAAEIMYYGGDVAELLLAGALVATWRPVRRHRPGTSGARRVARRAPARTAVAPGSRP
ncbi:cytochrome c oxidase assembly protein [Streptomyces sp. URMC 127]|uniref:cytochrome c oxidase assembly protein n=1 Tax=Streptomyces sp. URMC 127 TaxID=3423402 RepID=UPI003F1A322A